MNLGPHAAFILAAYGAALVVIGLMIVWVVADHRAQRRLLAQLEGQGGRPRSASPSGGGR